MKISASSYQKIKFQKGVKEEKGTYFVHFANSNMAVVLVHP